MIHGCVMVLSSRQAGRRQVAVLKAQEDQGAGVSTRVIKEGQWRGASEVVVMVVRMMVL